MASKIAPASFYSALQAHGFKSFYGVPDSLLKELCAFITDNAPATNHVITANEGNAMGMATGYHLATGEVPVVYMQNSGIGNALNPLLSLTHKEVYCVPALLLVGWRGDPGKHDEPQHVAQGRLITECLAAAEVPFRVLDGQCDERKVNEILDLAQLHFKRSGTPYAVLIKRDTFDAYSMKSKKDLPDLKMSRESAIETVIGRLGMEDIVVSTTGMISRELFEARARMKSGHHRDFLTVGSMGHCSSIAAGIALQKPDRNVIAIDGDGAALMHMGAMGVNAALGAITDVRANTHLMSKYKHIVLNNGAHDSVGGQPTVGMDVSLTAVAKACGYRLARDEPVLDHNELAEALPKLMSMEGPAFLEILVKKGNRKDLGRPTTTPTQNKQAIMKFISDPKPFEPKL